MKIPFSILLVPVLLLTSACSTHYSASSHHRYGHGSGHVSVGGHGSHHSRGGELLGALIIGGIVGHLLTEASEQESARDVGVSRRNQVSTADDALLNGYPITQKPGVSVERSSEQARFYQIGKDGNCYLMEEKQSGVEVISMVPDFSCL